MKRILSIMGGGVRGASTTCQLVELERQLGKPCREVFDFIAGTSTGALIAGALAAGVPAESILDIYRNRCSEIFHTCIPATELKIVQGWAYDPRHLETVLRSVLGPAASWKMNDCPVKVLITAVSASGTPWYFVPDNPKNAKATGGLSLLDCMISSSCAPTYFDGWYVSPNPLTLELFGWSYDGGAGVAANPAYKACVEAFCYDDSYNPADTMMVSVGTGYFPRPRTANKPDGLLSTISMVIDSLLGTISDEQTEIVDRHYPGVQTVVNWPLPKAIDMASVASVPLLIEVGQQAAQGKDWQSILKL